ncbi:MAG: hypothetical protein EOO26_02065 [Comamonadaceae bacterium]|nr:MAG: hypothetical protein EOO26_02065 [Comamonadaceae bacterium]
MGLFAGAWLLINFAYEKLRYVRAGSDLVALEKTEKIAAKALFPGNEQFRVIALGNSKTLSSFKPEVFDAALGGDTRSYNFGLPGEEKFLPVLEKILASGNRPTHLLLQIPWSPDQTEAQQRPLIKDDNRILNTLVPFRRFFRDLTLFVFQSRKVGLRAEWTRVQSEVQSVDQNRGWYFISAQSRYPNDQLPADFSLPSDNAKLQKGREFQPSGKQFAQLEKLAEQYKFQVLMVPWAARTGEYAPAADPGTIVVDKDPYIAAVGPNYWLYSPTSFSDPVHMNKEGAEAYSKRLATFLRDTGALTHAARFKDLAESK